MSEARDASREPHRAAQTAASERDAQPAPPAKPPRLSVRSGYSLFVGTMKVLLPALAVAIVLVVVVWPQIAPDESAFRVGMSDMSPEDAANLTMLNARFEGRDDRGRPFTVSAETATQASSGAKLVELEQPQADITLNDGAWLSVTAARGKYWRDREVLRLAGGVSLFHDRGFEMRTERVDVDLKAGQATSGTPVEGQGPSGTLKAEGFRLLDEGERIVFTGKSKLTVFADEIEGAR